MLRRALQGAGLLLVSLLLSLLVAEAMVRAFGWFERERALASILVAEPPLREEEQLSSFRIHPFLGWATQDEMIWTARDAAGFTIGFFGGSVAKNLGIAAVETFPGLIARELSMPEDAVVIKNFAAGGYKQPQQLLALAQAVMLGMRLDVVLNLDGFNEVALGGVDCRAGHHPLFPSRTHYGTAMAFLRGNVSLEHTEAAIEVRRLRERARRLATLTEVPAVGSSALVEAVVGTIGGRWQTQAMLLEGALQQRIANTPQEEALVPSPGDPRLSSRHGCAELTTSMWAQASVEMARLSEVMGARYVHVLQPNQYVANSKTFSEEELRSAYLPSHGWARNAAYGYPLLQREGRALQRRGIEFHDLTGIFRDTPETIYTGTCCHMNATGRRMVLERIAGILRSHPGDTE